MNKLLAEWKKRLQMLKNVSEEPEYYERILKGRAEANRYVVGMFMLSLFSDTVALLLTLLGVIEVPSVLWTVICLAGIFLCRVAAVIVGFVTDFSGVNTHYILFGLALISLFFDGVWAGEFFALFFVIPIMLAMRYYDITFSGVICGASLFGFTVTNLCSCLVWNSLGYTSYVGAKEILSACFNYSFVVCFVILLLVGLASVCGTAGGRMMMLEEAEILSAQTKAEYEASEAKTQIMISQIQPHFIYNTLNAICYLCEKEPTAAQSALSDFSDYLRENLNLGGKAEMIPFEREFQHVQKYLSLEKMRFEDELRVETNITCSDFRIPALTVQPLVENAVKHGICHRDGGGTVKIETGETPQYYKIIISDDGIGFDPDMPNPDSTRRHIGLENTRNRLYQMCRGVLSVNSVIGKGTVITISLPKEYDV